MKTKILFILLATIMIACAPKKVDFKKCCDELLQADRDFSQYSVDHGKNAAFVKFAAEDVTFLAANTYPLVGIKLLEERQSKRPDTTYILKWEPTYARAAESGELGYTYGTWELTVKADTPTISKGTYVTFWQRQADGEWKYVLDTGHEGLGEEKK